MTRFWNQHIHGTRSRSFIFATLITLLAPLMAMAAPTVTVSGDLTPTGELEIGGHLDAAFGGVVPFKHYSILLVDEANQVVAGIFNEPADAGGGIAPQRLWTRSGVVGCDVGAVHDPAHYQFISFDEADSILNGRLFYVWLIEGTDRSRVLTMEKIEFRTVTHFIEGYPSDGAGCLRTAFGPGESLHLAIEHQGGAMLPLQINLVAAQAQWLAGQPIIDVRGVPQVMNVPAGASPWVELMWVAPLPGDYQVIVRPITSTGPYDPFVDLLIETGFKHAGATVNECGAVCPP